MARAGDLTPAQRSQLKDRILANDPALLLDDSHNEDVGGDGYKLRLLLVLYGLDSPGTKPPMQRDLVQTVLVTIGGLVGSAVRLGRDDIEAGAVSIHELSQCASLCRLNADTDAASNAGLLDAWEAVDPTCTMVESRVMVGNRLNEVRELQSQVNTLLDVSAKLFAESPVQMAALRFEEEFDGMSLQDIRALSYANGPSTKSTLLSENASKVND